MKVTVAGKGGVGKTTISALLVRWIADGGSRTLGVDCDPNPMLAESFALDSGAFERFGGDDLERAGGTLALRREPSLVQAGERLWLLGGPPSQTALSDAVARGIAGVILSERFDVVLTDLGAGLALARVALGGVLNPAEVCIVVSDGSYLAERTSDQIRETCLERGVPALAVLNRRGEAEAVAGEVLEWLRMDAPVSWTPRHLE